MPRHAVTITLSPAEHAALDERAKSDGKPPSTVARELLARALRVTLDRPPRGHAPKVDDADIADALAHHKGDEIAAAKACGIHVTTLRRRFGMYQRARSATGEK